MAGLNMVGVMVVLENGQPNKKEYRKFIIRTRNKADDIGALKEVLERRLLLQYQDPDPNSFYLI